MFDRIEALSKSFEYQAMIVDRFNFVKKHGGIQILSLPRQVGKTHKAIELLKNHISEVAIIVPLLSHTRRFPIHLQKQVFYIQQANEFYNDILRQYSIFIIDEGFGIVTPELIQLYYNLGRANKAVLVLGTKL